MSEQKLHELVQGAWRLASTIEKCVDEVFCRAGNNLPLLRDFSDEQRARCQSLGPGLKEKRDQLVSTIVEAAPFAKRSLEVLCSRRIHSAF